MLNKEVRLFPIMNLKCQVNYSNKEKDKIEPMPRQELMQKTSQYERTNCRSKKENLRVEWEKPINSMTDAKDVTKLKN